MRQSEIIWEGIVTRPIPARCRAIMEGLGHVTFWISPERSRNSRQWVRYSGVPAEFLEVVATMLLAERELTGVHP